MIVAAGLLVLLGLALFVGGLVTGATAFYWACVAVCLLAAVLLAVARLRLAGDRDGDDAHRPAADPGGRGSGEPAPTERGEGGAGTGERAVAVSAAPQPDAHPQPVAPPRSGAHELREDPAEPTAGEPAEEDVEVTDLLLVVDLRDEVLVVDEHPRYHRAGCPLLDSETTVPLPMVEARTDGFTPCGTCRPVRHAAAVERSRRRVAHGE